MDEAKAAIIGTGTSGGIIILNWVHDIIPVISTIGIIAGSILAVHGVYELIMKHWRKRFGKETDC